MSFARPDWLSMSREWMFFPCTRCTLRKGTMCFLPALEHLEQVEKDLATGVRPSEVDLSVLGVDPRDQCNHWRAQRDPNTGYTQIDDAGDTDWPYMTKAANGGSWMERSLLTRDEMDWHAGKGSGGIFSIMAGLMWAYFFSKGRDGIPKKYFELIRDELDAEEAFPVLPDYKFYWVGHDMNAVKPEWCGDWKRRHLIGYSNPVAILKMRLWKLGLEPKDWGYPEAKLGLKQGRKVDNFTTEVSVK